MKISPETNQCKDGIALPLTLCLYSEILHLVRVVRFEHYCDDPTDTFGGGFCLAVASVGIAQSHGRLAVAEKACHDWQRRALHYSMAGIRVPKIVDAHILDAGFPADHIPEWKHITQRASGTLRRWKHEFAVTVHPALDDGPCLGVQKHRSRSGLAVEESETIFSHLLFAKADNLVLPATGQKEQPDDVDLLALRWTGRFGAVMSVKHAMQSAKFFLRKETG